MFNASFASSKLFARRHALLAAVLAIALLGGCMAERIGASRTLARSAEAFSTEPAQVRARLLIVGDSTGVGTGASSGAASVAGQLAARSPSLAIDNQARNGARFRDLPAQLAAASGKRYDVILIMAGGNDVINFTREGTLREDIDRVALQAKAMAPLVVIMPAGQCGQRALLPSAARVMGHDIPRAHAACTWYATRRRCAASPTSTSTSPARDDPFALEPKALQRGRRAASEATKATACGCTSSSRNPRSPPCSRWDTLPACLFSCRRAVRNVIE